MGRLRGRCRDRRDHPADVVSPPRISRRAWSWTKTAALAAETAALVVVIQFDPYPPVIAVIAAIIAAEIGIGIWYTAAWRPRQKPHLFDPDQWSRTSAVVAADAVLTPVEGGDGIISGRSLVTCGVCGMGEPWRAHQDRAWRFRHPFRTWRPGPGPRVSRRF